MRLTLFAVVVSLCAIVEAASPLPAVTFIYPAPAGTPLDRLCPEFSKTPVDPRWITETVERLREFQALWDKDAPAYASVLAREVGLDYPFHEVQPALTVCPALSSLGSPLVIQVRAFLASDGNRAPTSLFSILVFHELMHRYTERVHAVSSLEKKYAGDGSVATTQLHGIALERLVLTATGKTTELKAWEEIYRTRRSPDQKRAWEVVSQESVESFVKELRQLRR